MAPPGRVGPAGPAVLLVLLAACVPTATLAMAAQDAGAGGDGSSSQAVMPSTQAGPRGSQDAAGNGAPPATAPASRPRDSSGPPQPGIDLMAAPAWWLSWPADVRKCLENLPGVEIEEIGRTVGGRTIIAASYGPREMLHGRTATSLASADSSGNASAFYGQGQREHQMLLVVGAAHGTELEGTVAAVNYMSVLATGKDLVGRDQSEMAQRGRRLRFVLIPFLNVDGRERAAHVRHWVNVQPRYFDMITQGLDANDRIMKWSPNKAFFPQPLAQRKILGTYFNDAGVNLVYDVQLGPDMQPENAALVRYCRRELPDCALFSHSDSGSLVMAPSALMPESFRSRVFAIGTAVGTNCKQKGYSKHSIPRQGRGGETSFYHTDAIYHASGALPLLVEFPYGLTNNPGHLEILDIGLTVLDEVARYGAEQRFRPPRPARGNRR